MGSCMSTEADGEGESQARPVAARPVEVVWETDSQWEELNEIFSKTIAEQGQAGNEIAKATQQPEILFAAVRSWLDRRYRDCARTGTIEEMDPSSANFATSDGVCNWPSKQILALDSCYTGVVLALTFILAAPLPDGEEGPKPGAMLETPEMEGAKAYMSAMFQQMELGGANMSHGEIYIFMGADMVRGKWRPSTKEPTINQFSNKPSDAFRKTNDGLAKASRRESGIMVIFLPLSVAAAIEDMQSTAPGTTVWDEGELPFTVSGEPYPQATRLLVARDYREMDQEVEATHYKIASSVTDLQKPDCPRILRSVEPDKHPGGVVHIRLLCALPLDAPWPRCGTYIKKPQMKAAEAALIELLKKWNRQGKVQRCVAEVTMGADKIRFSFVGEPMREAVPSTVNARGANKIEGDIDGFLVKLVEEPKHGLFNSESHFQAVKAMMQERAMQDPEGAKAMVQQVAAATTRHFLELNYPGTDISNEGAFPTIIGGGTFAISDTILMVARDPKKEQKNIVAVIFSVPIPDGESPMSLPGGKNKSWLDTQEMKSAVAALLDLMKQWYKEGKLSEEDCMAQVMMGMDADIYQFVEGERFEDPSEERMKQFNWG